MFWQCFLAALTLGLLQEAHSLLLLLTLHTPTDKADLLFALCRVSVI